MITGKPYWVTATPEQLAQRLVDSVSCATQLDVEKGELANVEDWRRNAESMFKLIIRDRCATEAAEAARSQLAVAVAALDEILARGASASLSRKIAWNAMKELRAAAVREPR